MDISSTHSTLTTIGGWVVIVLVGGTIYYRSFISNQPNKTHERRGSFTKVSGRQNDADLTGDTKKKTEKAAKPKPKPKAPANTSNEATTPSVNYNRDEDEAADRKADREFARQLSNAHTGTKFNTKTSDDKRQKSVKQSKAREISDVSGGKTSVPSSHAGDADDDLSSQASPVVGAINGQDVSDMLEPTPAGPSVLRLTDTDSVKKPKERKQKALEVVETKKQRQNRKKNEAAKAAREQEEKERKVLMEQQRRTARIAEGRAAKDGSTFVANTKNAWDGKSANNDNAIQPLDTYEQQPKAEAAKPSTQSAAATTQEKADPWVSGMPSEEEQMELLRLEDSWSEVKTKKKGKKRDSSVETSTPSAQTTNGASNVGATKPAAPINGTKKPILVSSNSSFAALTPEGTDDNEEEWDV